LNTVWIIDEYMYIWTLENCDQWQFKIVKSPKEIGLEMDL